MTVKTRRIVCPVDFSDESLLALALAASYAVHTGGTLWMVHVLKTFWTEDANVDSCTALRELDVLRSTVHRQTNGKILAVPMVRVGDVADEISSLATEIGADIVVMATHGRTAWERCRDGSIFEEVSFHCPCPVVSVKSILGSSLHRVVGGRGVGCLMCMN
jgi:nucleotide-binding universal stress UspA family protein